MGGPVRDGDFVEHRGNARLPAAPLGLVARGSGSGPPPHSPKPPLRAAARPPGAPWLGGPVFRAWRGNPGWFSISAPREDLGLGSPGAPCAQGGGGRWGKKMGGGNAGGARDRGVLSGRAPGLVFWGEKMKKNLQK